ncbi:hypothetical protein VTK56DRAFT_8277 [Thermocarpiscus australiensis]
MCSDSRIQSEQCFSDVDGALTSKEEVSIHNQRQIREQLQGHKNQAQLRRSCTGKEIHKQNWKQGASDDRVIRRTRSKP